MVRMFRVGVAFFLALICVGSFVSVSTVSPAWAVDIWTQVGSDIDGEAFDSRSGSSVSFSSDGSRVAIGAIYNDDGGEEAGQVRVYDWTGIAWIQVGGDIDGEAAGDFSGWELSLSSGGSRVAIGAPGNDDGGEDAGHVRVYRLTSGAWVQVGGDINGEAGDGSGHTVSLSSGGSRVAIGAADNVGSGSDAGHVRVYDWTGIAWVQVGGDINGEAAGDYFGTWASFSSGGSRVAIGAPGNDDGGEDAGHVRVYRLTSGAWVQVGGDIDGEAAGDNFGYSVSFSSDGSRVAIGAPGNSGGGPSAGQVRVYRLTGGNWVQVGSDIDGEAAADIFGSSVSFSSDGSRVAIGAPGNDDGGEDAGHVRVYRLTSGAWVQVGGDIDGEAAGDFSGYYLSFSSDGFRVAIGAPYNGSVALAGHVRVYDLTGRGITSEPRSLIVTMKRTESKTLAWQVPASLNGGSITDYIIQYRVARTALWSTFADGISTSRRVTVTGLTKKLKYQFRVAARTTGGDSPYSTATKAS